MTAKCQFPEILIKLDSNTPSLEINPKNLEDLIFEQLPDYPYVVQIAPFDKQKEKIILYSTNNTSFSFLTIYLGHDFNGVVRPKKVYIKNRLLIKDLQIEHACSLERVFERHIERTADKTLYSKEKIFNYAIDSYSKLITAMELD